MGVSCIIAFADDAARDRFMMSVARDRPDIHALLKPAFSEPSIIARQTQPEQDRWLEAEAKGRGTYIPEHHVDLFGPPGRPRSGSSVVL